MLYGISAVFNQQWPFSDTASLGLFDLVALDVASTNFSSELQADR